MRYFSFLAFVYIGSVSLPGQSAERLDQAQIEAGLKPDLAAEQKRVTAVPLSATDIVIEWKAPKLEAESFVIERRSLTSDAWISVATLGGHARLYRDNGLAPRTVYEYRVTATTAGADSVLDKSIFAKTDDPARRTIFFVSANTGNDNNPGTEALPWKSLQHAHKRLQPGQTVLVKAGEYRSKNFAVLAITNSGRPDAWITYRNFPGQRPAIRSTVRANWSGIDVRHASYIVIDGFEFIGHSSEVNLKEALAEMRKPTPYASSSGISVESRDLKKPIAHHVIIRNNYIHDHPLAGIGINGADYVTLDNNRVAYNSRFSSYGGSGISILVPRDSDKNTTAYKFIVRNNVSKGNSNEVACGCYGYKQPTDGNGIILDSYKAYKGRTLIANNLVYNNGGRGMHIFHAGNADVFFNTSVRNSKIAITGDGEITVVESKNVRVRDNIMVARDDRPVNSTRKSQNVDFSYNIVSGGTRFAATNNDTNRLDTDPLFVNGDGSQSAGFALRPDSPAIDSASGTVPSPGNDLYLGARGQGSLADVGALESN
ncbi:MAG TPA: right-handed parallel beta-helix repeat-containing protein [Oligoflexus sp.]|uniref:right-handed parallel beta-helix repeat-containing protein n=1 Tax=Oligoflexus sp. TaxID=1971216 RepID=UPI002D59015D|nr:right-handed parallel beta-helix repeat-containing protein [Oligoflexus sp.]HYX37819.1 right-handed parallel beta-helix repeat-containing protein [Oligoflexus sp.]